MAGMRRLAIPVLLLAQSALAGPAEVVAAEASCRGELCRFTVTVRHADTGWEHYATRTWTSSPSRGCSPRRASRPV